MNSKFDTFIDENKLLIYPALFYIAGLIIAQSLFKYADLSAFLKAVYTIENYSVSTLILSRILLYSLVFTITVLLSFSAFGFVFINAAPLLIGFTVGLKLSYFCTLLNTGIAYVLFLIAPQSALFVTLLLYTVKHGSLFSRGVYSFSIKRTDTAEYIEIRQYLKLVLIYFVFIVLSAAINGVSVFLVGKIIHF